MHRAKKLYLLIISTAVALALALGTLASCGDDESPSGKEDAGAQKDGASKDAPVFPDVGAPDKPVYPDTRRPFDTKPWVHAEGYMAGTFGCQSDADCFGQRCCDTPWGVKLCAPTCN
jgi:hypothetical protein